MYTPNLHFIAGTPTLHAQVLPSSSNGAQMSDVPIPPSPIIDTSVLGTPVKISQRIDTPISDTAALSTLRVNTVTTQISDTSRKDVQRSDNPAPNTSHAGSLSPRTIMSRKPVPYPLNEEDPIANAQMPTPLIVITAGSNGSMQTSRAQGTPTASTFIQDSPTMNTPILCTSIPSITITRATTPSNVFPSPLDPHATIPVMITTSPSAEGVLNADRPTVCAPMSTTTIRIRTDTSPAKPTPGRPSTTLIPVRGTPNSKAHIPPHVPSMGRSTLPTSSPNNPRKPSWAIDQPLYSLHFHTYQNLVPPPRTLCIASAILSNFGPARMPKGVDIDVFARYCSFSNTIWIAVRKIRITENVTKQGSTCSDSLTWMTWCTYLRSEVAKKPWIRVRSSEYSNTFGRLSEEAIVRAWTEEDRRNKGVEEAWKRSFKGGVYYRRSQSD
jgi:hypothetical protein